MYTTEQDISAPPLGRHRLGAAVWALTVSALTLYAAAVAATTLHSDTNNTSGS